MRKHFLIFCFMVICLYISIPVSAAQYSFHYSSAAVKAGSVSNVYVYKGNSKQNPKGFEWSSSNENVVSVVNGKVTAKKAGAVWIKAVKDGQISKMKLYSYEKTKKVSFGNGDTGEVKIGDTLTLKPSAEGILSSYKSSNTKVATVSKNGQILAKSSGSVKITYTSYGKVKYIGTFSLTVRPALTSFSVQEEIVLKKGDSADIVISKTPANGYVNSISYKSNNKKIATVTSDGKVIAQACGSTRITVQVDNGEEKNKTAQIRIYVVDSSYSGSSGSKYILHRGASLEAPENTLPAFEIAAKTGGYIETDVQKTKDGVFVLCHDTNLKRMCGVDKKIADITYKELQQYPVISGNNADRYPDNYIPTLQQYLDVCNRYGAVPVIEIKWNMQDDELVKFNKMLRSSKKPPIIISFRVGSLKKLRLINNTVSIQYIMRGGATEKAIAICEEYKFDISVGYSKLSKGSIDKLHGKGIKVATWEIIDNRLIGLYESFGVDYITVEY